MKRAFIFTSDAVFALYLIITILSILFLLSYEPTVHIEQSQDIAEDVVAVMGEYKAGYAVGDSLYPYTNYLLNNGRNSSDWPMFHRSLTHDGYVGSSAPNTNLTFWSVNLTGVIFSSPAVYEGIVYVTSENFTYAIDEATGILIWSVPIGTNSSPSVNYRQLFIGAKDNRTYALDRLTGRILWSTSTNGSISSSPAVADGKVFIGSDDGRIYAFDEDSGAQIWNRTIGGAVYTSPAISGERVFIISGGYLYALNKNDGTVIWRYAQDNPLCTISSPAVAYGKIFVGDDNARFNAINESNGSPVWETGGNLYFSSSPAVHAEKVFIAGLGGGGGYRIYAYNESTGNVIWSTNINYAFSNSSPAVADGKVFIGSENGSLLAFNETNGNLIWSYSTGSPIQSSPAIASGRIYFGNKDGMFYSIGDCSIEGLNKTILELVGEFWSINKTSCSTNLFQDVFQVGHVATYSNKLLLRFNEGDGSTTVDIMNGNNGILVNSPNWTAGKIAKGLQFNGIDQLVVVNSSPSLNNFNRLTMEAWFKTNDTRNMDEYIICKISGVTCSYGMSINPGLNGVGFTAGSFTYRITNLQTSSIGSNVSDGNWHHLAVVVIFTPIINATVYVDGQNLTSGYSPTTPLYTGEPLYVGQGPGSNYKGIIDEVAIYNDTKIQDEIKRDYFIEGVIPSRYGFEFSINAGPGAGRDCLNNSGDWDTIITNDCERSKYTKILSTSTHFISAIKKRGEPMAVPYALGPTLVRMDVWN